MKPTFTPILALLLLAVSQQTLAQFSGTYAPANWTVGRSLNSNGSINSTGAPGTIIITGSDDPAGEISTPEYIDFSIAVPTGGTWSFDWAYHTNDSYNDPQYDHAGVLVNGAFTKLSDDLGAVDQSGTHSGGAVIAGTVIGFRILATDNTFGDATFTITNFQVGGGTLPVTGLSFKGVKSGNDVKLNWSTLTESNTDHFAVLHSRDGINFQPLTLKAAAGNSNTPTFYNWLHTSPSPGKNFYQLQQVDIDGRQTLSGVVQVNLGTSKMSILPNPAVSGIVLNYPYNGKPATLTLLNSSGAIVLRKTISSEQTRVDIGALPAGVYMAQVSENGELQSSIKIMKQ